MNLTFSADHYLLTMLVKGIVFATLAVGFGALLQRRWSARSASLYWRMTVMGLLVLPLAAVFLPGFPVFKESLFLTSTQLPAESPVDTEWKVSYPASPEPSADMSSLTPPVSETGATGVRPWNQGALWLSAFWLGGAILVLLRWVVARFRIANLCRGSRPAPEGWLGDSATTRAEVKISPEVLFPMVWGSRRPVILLPVAAMSWDPSTRRTVLTHELAHTQRRDSFFQFAAQCATALHWPNPLAWLIARHLRLADERCADDSVLETGCEADVYAALLVRLARASCQTPLAALAMAEKSSVGRRVERLLDADQYRGAPGMKKRIGVILGALAAAGLIGTTTAQEKKAESSEDQPAPPTEIEKSSPVEEDQRDPFPIEILAEKLNTLIIPRVSLEDATLEESIEFLRAQSVDLDTSETAPSRKGVNFLLPSGTKTRITLELTEVPLAVALNYICKLSGTTYKLQPEAVVIVVAPDMFTRTFRVPPGFLGSAPNARTLLESSGIEFPEGASAIYQKQSSTLIARNDVGNMELIEAFVDLNTSGLTYALLRMEVELYEVPKEIALRIASEKEHAHESVTALLGKGDARLLASPTITTRSGQRARAEAGNEIKFISDYEGKDGRDLPIWDRRFHGTLMECEPILGADGYTVNVELTIEASRGAPVVTKRVIPGPATGENREIETVALHTLKLRTDVTCWDGQTVLAGNLQSQQLEDSNAVLAFVRASLVDPSGKPIHPSPSDADHERDGN